MAAISEQLGRYEIDKTLTPTGFLYDKEASAPFNQVLDSLNLSFTEVRRVVAAACPEKLGACISHFFYP
jgi:hypothetical protein